jgi:hypothetical protein
MILIYPLTVTISKHDKRHNIVAKTLTKEQHPPTAFTVSTGQLILHFLVQLQEN